jgi:hypothetical protein
MTRRLAGGVVAHDPDEGAQRGSGVCHLFFDFRRIQNRIDYG